MGVVVALGFICKGLGVLGLGLGYKKNYIQYKIRYKSNQWGVS